jgi:cyclohexadienyl dehydratase
VKLFPSLLVALLLWAGALNAQPRLIDDEAAVDAVFAHVADRLELMPAVAAAKWLAGSAVSDPAREQALLDRSASAALAMGLAEQAVRELLQLQMRLARDAQQRLHAQWREGGCDSCAGAASLQQTRARLDALGAAQLRALYVAAPVLDDAGFQARFASRAEQRLRQLIPDAADRGQLLAALAAVQRTQQPGLARIRASGVLLIGTTGDYAPFSLEAGGLLEGSDIERGLALATGLGVEGVFVRTSWPGLMRDFADARFDVALSGISITPERQQAGLFSTPYHEGGKTILARCAERQRFAGLDGVDREGVRVIVNPGGTNERFVRENIHRAAIVLHPDNRSVFAEIVAGRADVMITDDIEADLQARLHPELCRAMAGTLTRAYKAVFMVRDAALKQRVDEWLAR